MADIELATVKAKGDLSEANLERVLVELLVAEETNLLARLGKLVAETDGSMGDWLYEFVDSKFTDEEYNTLCAMGD